MINTLTTYKSSLLSQVISDDVSIKQLDCSKRVNSINCHFNTENYHVFPQLIERFHEAKVNDELAHSHINISKDKDINIIALQII